MQRMPVGLALLFPRAVPQISRTGESQSVDKLDQLLSTTAKRSRSSAARKSALAAAFSGSSGMPVASATRSIALKRPTTPAASTSPAEPARHRIDRDTVSDDRNDLDIMLLGETAGDDTAIPAFAEAGRIGPQAMDDLDRELRELPEAVVGALNCQWRQRLAALAAQRTKGRLACLRSDRDARGAIPPGAGLRDMRPGAPMRRRQILADRQGARGVELGHLTPF
jgi:hypothetical protein